MQGNCSRPCNSTEKNDSNFLQFGPNVNFDQAIAYDIIAISVVNAFFSFTALLGNFAILLTIWKTSSLHSPANILLSSLAVSDFAVGLLIQPLFVAVIQSELISAITLVFIILVYFFCFASFTTITAITLDRLLILQLHLRYHSVVTTVRVTLVVIFIWVLSGVSTLLMMISVRFPYVFLATIISLLAGNFAVYIKIYAIARRHQRQIQQQQQPANNEHIFRVTRYTKTAFNSFLVYIVLLCCYMPYSFVSLYGNVSAIVYWTTGTLVFINSSLNPLLYCWRDREIRTAMKRLFCR